MIDFLTTNWGSLAWGLFGLAWVIVRLTPTKTDDVILKILGKLLHFFIPDRKKKRRSSGL